MEAPSIDPFKLAGWGSLVATLLLAAFLTVQAFTDRERRRAYAFFAIVCLFNVADDLLRSAGTIDEGTWHLFRLLWSAAYVGAVLRLLGIPARTTWPLAAAVLGIGLAARAAWGGSPATSVTFPLAFGLTAFALAREARRNRGFAASVLSAYGGAMVVMCAAYHVTMATANPLVILAGYAHFVLVTAVSLVLGWVHLPRELRGEAPVRVRPFHAGLHAAGVLVGELAVQGGLLFAWGNPPWAYLLGTMVQISATVGFYFHHRNHLVNYTVHIEQLLEGRTVSLREAQELLARQNELQAEQLDRQARELRIQGETIDRQRRLELAAQTAGQAAHDIQNLLTPILAQVAKLQREEGTVDVRREAGRLRTHVEQLLDLNGQLLALSRRGRMDRHPVRLRELADELSARFPGAPVRIEVDGDPWISGSWSQLSRAFSNLVGNALDVAPRRRPEVVVRLGTVVVAEPRRCHLGYLAPGRHAYLAVEDSGPGIPEEARERIFEPFYSTKRGNGSSGSGLGLSIVTAVAEDHAGTVDLDTGPAGTRFTLYLPEGRAAGEDGEPGAVSPDETVAVIDDDDGVRERCVRILEESGYHVIPLGDGEETIRLLQTERVDLLLLDLKMPRMTGLETFFGAIHLRPDVRAVIHSSYVTDEEVRKLGNLGVTRVLAKPAGRRELLRAVRETLDDRRPVASDVSPRAG